MLQSARTRRGRSTFRIGLDRVRDFAYLGGVSFRFKLVTLDSPKSNSGAPIAAFHRLGNFFACNLYQQRDSNKGQWVEHACDLPLSLSYTFKYSVNIIRQFGVFVLILLWSLVPEVACAAPDAQMTASERACCIQMKSECGNMDMPFSQGCCHKEVQADHSVALHSDSENIPVSQSLALHAGLDADSVLLASQPPFRVLNFVGTSPPQSPPLAIAVLRI